MSALPYFFAAALLFAVAANGPALHAEQREHPAQIGRAPAPPALPSAPLPR